jgi:16S rRNA (cytosine967-C5)-methyltransferase
MRSPIGASEIGGLAELINAQGELRSLPSHLPGPEPRFAGIDGFFAARLKRRG